MNETQENSTTAEDADLKRLDSLARLLDNQFRVPFTSWRFGLDGIMGLVPYAGDLTGLAVSGILLRTMIKKGAGPLLLLRMMGNYVLDTLIGIVPVVGDLFDFSFKANRRNVALLKQYYADGHVKPDVKHSAAILGFVFLLLFAGLIWAMWKLAAMAVGWIWVHLPW